jgi:hypothetical protein
MWTPQKYFLKCGPHQKHCSTLYHTKNFFKLKYIKKKNFSKPLTSIPLLSLGFVFFNSWDEWVGMDRLMKFTEENVQKQNALNKKQLLEKNAKLPHASLIKPKSSNG